MAGKSIAGEEKEEGEEDYMGNLSQFLPPDLSSSDNKHSLHREKQQDLTPVQAQPSNRRNRASDKGLSWQEQRRLDRQRKQREEDERTKAGLETAIPDSNIGFKLLRRMGYEPGLALGKDGSGSTEPVGVEIRRTRAGIGVEEERERREKERERREKEEGESKRRREEEREGEFGERQRTRWRGRRVYANYRKAELALAQLENRDIVAEAKREDEEEREKEKDDEDEEEKIITEEDLENILMKLREEHQYCLYCGYQYESEDALITNCPGPSEDDH